jgi:hypothetical protein
VALWKSGTWIFGAFRESELVGVLAATQKPEEVNKGIGNFSTGGGSV